VNTVLIVRAARHQRRAIPRAREQGIAVVALAMADAVARVHAIEVAP
jgi:uncharacterized SAM-binding protein YcdF (DUF218 family)